jgi:NAD(P)-dependent dehydrogenase (short-subunit alcohol dehydrogenase family)
MRRVLVTGANKGIGLAIARGILAEHDDTFVLLGSRERARGQAAIDALTAERPSF